MRLSLPVSILSASVILALGLYFGLRTPTAVAPTPTPAPAPAPAPASPPVIPTPGPTEAETAATVTDLVARAHPGWKAACWDTADPSTRKPGHYVVTLAFSAEGVLTISGVSEDREASDPSVAHCLRRHVHAFSIPAPGHAVTFDVPVRMP